MATKVLVFESDAAFAGELRTELGKLGCSTVVVDDGNLGLQQAAADKPDLILLSIELPRMNGFSVCNKLKKDPNLKGVPLIIMSSESSFETFEQHKKLRTRAEDYVQKPIAFGELLKHVQGFVPLAPPARESDGAIVIDDEIEINGEEYIGDDNVEVTMEAAPESIVGDRLEEEVDAFAESAFGRLTESEGAATATRNGVSAAETTTLVAHVVGRQSETGRTAKHATSPPAAAGADPAEHARLQEELAGARSRLQELSRALEEVEPELARLRAEAVDVERRGRELEELRVKVASGAKAGGREFLDLREALNKKDKEILALKEQIAKKDRQIVEAQDRALATERTQADLDERLLGLERELDETREKAEALQADRELAKKAGDDFRARLEKSCAEVEARDRQLGEARARHDEELAQAEERFAAMRAEVDQILANERAEHARELDQAEAKRRTDLEAAQRDRDGQVEGAHEEARQELARVRSEAERHEQAALAELEAEIQAESTRVLAQAGARAAELEADLAAARGELAALQQAKEELEGRISAYEARVASLEGDAVATRQDLAETRQRLEGETARADRSQAKWKADLESLERAKDALAMALAQIEEAQERTID